MIKPRVDYNDNCCCICCNRPDLQGCDSGRCDPGHRKAPDSEESGALSEQEMNRFT